MVSARTISFLAIISFIIGLIVWNMSEDKNLRLRGELLDKVALECASNITFLKTGKQDTSTKDVTDDALREMTTAGRQELETRWLMVLSAPGMVRIKGTRLIEIKKLDIMIQTYNADMSDKAEYYAGDDDYTGQRTVPPAKQQMIEEFEKLIKVLKEAKEHKNNLDF